MFNLGLFVEPVFESFFYGAAKSALLATESLHNLESQPPLNLV